jgi:arylsulfatase A-like enzyme
LLLTVVAVLCGGCDRSPNESPPAGKATAPARVPRLPNVVFIFADDQAPKTLGFEGNPHVRTPRLDRLAHEGAYFTRAYIPIPQCAPSRAAVLTGLYPHQNGVLTNKGARLKPDAVTFSELFKKKGYACGLVGKWHLGDERQPQAGFEDMWAAFVMPGEYYDAELWIDGQKVRTDGYLTDVLTDYAIRFVEQNAEKPFLLWLVFKAPHGPPVGPPDKRFIYDPDAIPLPESMADDLSGKPAWQRESYMHEIFGLFTEQQLRKRLAHYYGMISSVDHNVGRLVDKLTELKLGRDTLVIFMSDNGFLHGEHQMITKGPVLYEELVRSPLIMWWPGRIEPGTRIDSLVSSLDLFPTLCDPAGIPVPVGLPGKTLWPIISNPAASLRDALFFEYYTKEANDKTVPMRGLVTQRYKYVKYLQGGEELYDLQNDPHEMHNLIEDPAHSETAETLRKKLADWRSKSGDLP